MSTSVHGITTPGAPGSRSVDLESLRPPGAPAVTIAQAVEQAVRAHREAQTTNQERADRNRALAARELPEVARVLRDHLPHQCGSPYTPNPARLHVVSDATGAPVRLLLLPRPGLRHELMPLTATVDPDLRGLPGGRPYVVTAPDGARSGATAEEAARLLAGWLVGAAPG